MKPASSRSCLRPFGAKEASHTAPQAPALARTHGHMSWTATEAEESQGPAQTDRNCRCIRRKKLLFQQQKQGCIWFSLRVYLFQMQTNRQARRNPQAHLACPRANPPPKAPDLEKLQLRDTLPCGSHSRWSHCFNTKESTTSVVLRAEPAYTGDNQTLARSWYSVKGAENIQAISSCNYSLDVPEPRSLIRTLLPSAQVSVWFRLVHTLQL